MAPLIHQTVCVFCASSTKVSKPYRDATEQLATLLASNGIAIRYGGGEVGLMGVLANCTLALGGKITGIIPQFMVDVEWQHKDIEDMILVETMHQRKNLLIDNVDAVIALPGSTGTLEELVEVMSLKKLGLFSKPIIVINTNGFYNPLIEMLQKMVDEQFMQPAQLDLCLFIDEPTNIIEILTQTDNWRNDRSLAVI